MFNPSGSPLAINGPWQVRRVSTLVNITPLDEDLKSQFEDQLIIGADYQFRPTWSIGARFINRELRRIIEDIGTFTNPDDPLELTGYVIGNPGEGFFGAPFDKPTRSYKALELTLQRAYTNNWHLNRNTAMERDSDYVYEGMNGIEAWQADSNLDAFGNPKFNSSLPASPYFDTPILFQAPRSMQVGVKFTF